MSDQTEVIMPLMGEGITEATLVRWLKNPGEEVKKEEPLLEVSTDKVDTEIPAPASGFLVETFADEGATVEINAVIAHIAANPGAGASKAKSQPAKPAASPSKKAAATSAGAPTPAA